MRVLLDLECERIIFGYGIEGLARVNVLKDLLDGQSFHVSTH
jgi:hypothetical protein